jgi:hypothetical protein
MGAFLGKPLTFPVAPVAFPAQPDVSGPPWRHRLQLRFLRADDQRGPPF